MEFLKAHPFVYEGDVVVEDHASLGVSVGERHQDLPLKVQQGQVSAQKGN